MVDRQQPKSFWWSLFTPDGIQTVVTELMKKKIKTSPEYLQTGKDFPGRITKPSHISLEYHEL